MLNALRQHIKDALFPIFCVGCGKEGEWWCNQCFSKASLNPVLRCPICRATRGGVTCMACRDISFLSGIISLFEYRESSPEAKLVHAFKYSYALESAPIWLKIFKRQKEAFAILGDLGQNFTIIPVPLYSRRERERGFNQSKILAEILFEFLRLNFTNKNIKLNFDSLRRSRPTDQQVKLVKEEREKNVFNAFVWRGGYCDENVVLVDDVFTTGATMQECARVLKQAGAKSVWGVTLARSLSL